MEFLPLTREQLEALKPTYACSTPSRVHPKSEEINLYILQYLDEHWQWPSKGARESFIRSGIYTSVPYLVPDGKNELVVPASIWFAFWHWIDDTLEQCDLESQPHLRLIPLAEGVIQPEPGNHLEIMVYNMHDVCRKTGNEVQRRLFSEVDKLTLKWLKCVLSHRAAVESGASPVYDTLDDWLAFRKMEIAAHVMWPYLRWVQEIDLSPEILAHPDVKALGEIAGDHGVFVNDMYSLRKEINDLQKKARVGIKIECPNTVIFFATKHGITLFEAIEAMTRILEKYEQGYLEAERKAVEVITALHGEKNGELVREYASAVKLFMTGNVTWSGLVGRYNDLDITVPLHHSKTDEEVLGIH